jgi:hypothetical protein
MPSTDFRLHCHDKLFDIKFLQRIILPLFQKAVCMEIQAVLQKSLKIDHPLQERSHAMASRISRSTVSCIFLILLISSAMCLCSSCVCCYCTTICHCEDGDYTFDPSILQSTALAPCDNDAQCKRACADQNLGAYTDGDYSKNGFGCYSSCE